MGVGLRVAGRYRNIGTTVGAGLGNCRDVGFKLFWYSRLPAISAGHAKFWELEMGRVVAVVVSKICRTDLVLSSS